MKREQIFIAVLLGLLTFNVSHAGDLLAEKFAKPPAAARPWVYAFIVDGNLFKDRLTWSTWNPYKPTDPLLPSGLLGPVRLMTAE